MPPYTSLPNLLKPLHPPQHPSRERHDHTGHSHPYPRPSLRITSITLALLSAYILLLFSLSIFTFWRVSRKRSHINANTGTMDLCASSREGEWRRRDGFGDGGGSRSMMKGIVRSRVEPREVFGSGAQNGGERGSENGGDGRGGRKVMPNSHLSHEELGDTALLSGYTSHTYGTTGDEEGGAAGERGRDSERKRERERERKVPEGLIRAAEEGRGIFGGQAPAVEELPGGSGNDGN